jgi:hypothetical protein
VTQLLQQFVFDTLREWGASSAELAPGVWRFQLPEGDGGLAAWYLGRPKGELLVTFDLSRWEEGARLECLTPVSPLVRRLQQYAEGRGVYAIATVQADPILLKRGLYRYQPFLLCRFSGRYSSYRAIEERHWLSLSLTSGALVKVSGDPLALEGISQGEPEPDQRVEQKIDTVTALDKLIEIWEAQVSQRARTLVNESEAAYQAEVEEAMRVLSGADLAARIEMLAQRYAPVAESHLEAALLLWR